MCPFTLIVYSRKYGGTDANTFKLSLNCVLLIKCDLKIYFNFLLMRQIASAARRVLVLFRLFQTNLGNGKAMVAKGAEVVTLWNMSQERARFRWRRILGQKYRPICKCYTM